MGNGHTHQFLRHPLTYQHFQSPFIDTARSKVRIVPQFLNGKLKTGERGGGCSTQ